MAQASVQRPPRSTPSEKHDVRRRALAESALATLGELGYARASLREIANHSEFTHGVVHYYFRDKLELIVYCVAYYKESCVKRYDEALADAGTADEFAERFADKLVESIVEDAPMQRLWYDLRAQAMFEESLRDSVCEIDETLEQMIWRVFERYAELAGRRLTLTPHVAYGALDGMFQQALLRHLCEREGGLEQFREMIVGVMPLLVH